MTASRWLELPQQARCTPINLVPMQKALKPTGWLIQSAGDSCAAPARLLSRFELTSELQWLRTTAACTPCLTKHGSTNSLCTGALESIAFFGGVGKPQGRDATRKSPDQRAPDSDPAISKYASTPMPIYTQLTSRQAGFHTSCAADIPASGLSHQLRCG